MANTRSSQVATPGFDGQGVVSGSLPGVPSPSDPADGAIARVADSVGAQAGAFADTQAQKEGSQAGAIAGLDSTWRPRQNPTIRGQAYDQAAQTTYVNNLQTQTRQSIADAYEAYQALPVDQQQPSAFKKTLDGIKDQTVQGHVWPQLLPSFGKQFDDQAFTYLQKVQDDNDKQVQDASKASFIANQQSASNTAMRAASLVSPQGDALAQKEADAHDRLVDQQVQDGTITAVAAQKIKGDFRQALSSTAIMAKFATLDPAGQKAFLDTFQKSYGTGGDYFGRLAQIESSGDPNAVNKITGAAGLYAFMPKTAKQYGLADPTDPDAALEAVKRFTADNRAALTKSLGRAPTDGELYLAHQQGADGAARLLQNPDKPAVDVVGRAAVLNNGGTADMTAGQFATLWKSKFAANPTAGLDDSTYDTLRGQMAAQITRNTNGASELSRKSVAEINGVQSQIEAGNDVTPDAWFALQSKYSSSADPAVAAKLAEAGQVRSMLAGFKGQSPQQIEAAIANTQAGYAKAGATPQQAAVLASAQSYLSTYRSDLASDPLGRAAHEGVISGVQPIDFGNPAQATAGLQARVPQAQQAASYFGNAPTYLLPAEKAQLKAIAAKGGQPMIDAARATAQALGPDAAKVFSEVGGEAPAFATAGRVAAIGGSPAFLSDFARAQQIGQDPAARKSLELPSDSAADTIANTTIGTGLSAAPDLNAQVRQSARQVFSVRALDNNLSRKIDDTASTTAYTRGLQEAAGATFDGPTQYGGLTTYKPPAWWSSQRQPIVAPPGMRADGVGTAVKALTDADLAALPQPPVAGDGKTPLPATAIQGGYLTTVGHGVYWVSRNDPQGDDPQWAMAPGGGRFRLDLNALAPMIRQRVPDVYRGR